LLLLESYRHIEPQSHNAMPNAEQATSNDGAVAQEPSCVFSYGTLMSESVLEVVLGRVPAWTEGRVSGYARVPLCGRCYPGAVPRDGGVIIGRVLRGVSSHELARLDRFEGDEYCPVVETVRLDSGDTVRARLWALSDLNDVVPDSDWSFDRFVKVDQAWYLTSCKEWADQDDRNNGKLKP
jgi:gamma-glutamylcyclotransferase (GGCT)/AIG2-like uncharacterized protein YtfP